MSENKKLTANEDEVKVNVDKSRPVKLLVKNLIRYPNIKKKLGEYMPNVFFGYTDHPLDVEGTAYNTIFTFFKKTSQRKASCVLQAKFMERAGNSFIFLAKGYNVFQIRDIEHGYAHEYKITDKTPCEELTLKIDMLKSDAYRLRLAKGREVPENNTPMLAKDITDSKAEVSFSESDDTYTIKTSSLSLKIFKEKFRIEVYDSNGNLVTESGSKTKDEFPTTMDSFPLGFVRDKKHNKPYGVESFVIYPGESIYGLGEQFGPLNKVGKNYGFWHYEGLGNTSGRIYKNIPFFMSSRGYGIFINESKPITYWVGTREYCKNQIAVEGEFIDYYFFYGPSFKNILNTYTELTGKASVPPKWTFGTWMSRITYFSQEEVLNVAKKLREMKFPSDVIHIDTGWFQTDWLCDWQFNKKKFPDPKKMFEEAKEMGFRISLWQEPYVMDDTELYKEAKEKKVLAKNNGPFIFLFRYPGHPIDFSNPKAVKWYQEKLKNLLDMGASAIKVDFGEGIEPDMEFMKYDGRQMHNLYPLLYNKAAFDITRETKGKGVIWARSAYAGSQRYPIHWSGDNSANYENLLCSLRGGLSLGMCGFSFWSQDTGAFVGTPTDDLYIRWTQLSIFQSHIRYHGCPPRFREPWNYEPETQDIVREFLNLRYRLIPYLYTEAHAAAEAGLPMLRAMALEFQDDRTVHNIEDQFMCGRNLLIAPILTKDNTRDIYLPEGIWYDFWSGKKYEGHQWITVTCPIDRIPVFARGGSIVPLGKEAQCIDEIDDQTLALKVYPGSEGKASYELVDDERRVSFNAVTEEGSLKVHVGPGVSNISAELPEGFELPCGILINSHNNG